jgi:hypothetical protein
MNYNFIFFILKLCVGNYATLIGFVNGANDIFQDYTKKNPTPLIWINFHNP